LQEVALATSSEAAPCILFGSDKIFHFDTLATVLYLELEVGFGSMLTYLQLRFNKGSSRIFPNAEFYVDGDECLSLALRAQCHDPRDKVFALRSIYPEILGPVTVDYRAAVEQIYLEAATSVIRHGSDPLKVFRLLQPTVSELHLPSWVPDLSLSDQTIPPLFTLTPHNTTLSTSACQVLVTGSQLLMYGRKKDSLIICGEAFP
jgi:hypothetical protein